MRWVRWFWGLKLRWRIPLGLLALLAVGAGLYVGVAYIRYRQCRHIDLLAVVPRQLPAAARCRRGGAHWDRIRETDVWRAIEAQIERRGPLLEFVEAATGKSWNDLVAPLTTGPEAERLTDARLRGLFGADVVVGLDPPVGPFLPRAVLLTRIGFLEYLAYPFARRVVSGRLVASGMLPAPPVRDPYRGVDVYSCEGVRLGSYAPPSGWTLAFAVKGDILIAANDPDLVTDVIDRILQGGAAEEGEEKAPAWELPPDAPLAAGVDLHRLSPKAPAARALRGALQTFPVREALYGPLYGFDPNADALHPDALGRCTLALDVRPGQVRADLAIALRGSVAPIAPLPPPGTGAGGLLAAIPEHAAAFLVHRGSFDGFWQFFERSSLDSQRPVFAEDAIGGGWKLFQNQARQEIPALRSAGLDTLLMPRLRAGPAFVLTKESGPAPTRIGEPPLETVVGLVEADSADDTAETALHEVLQRRVTPLVTQRPGEVQETREQSVRVLRRRGPPPVQFAYGGARGVLAFGVRPEAIRMDQETLLGTRPGATRGARFRAVCQALDRAEPPEGKLPPDVLTLAFADLPRVRSMMAGMADAMARFAEDKVNGPELRRTLERRNLRRPGESDASYVARIDQLYTQEMQRVRDDARRRIERPIKLLEPFSAAGMEVAAEKEGYRVRGVLLVQ